MSNKKVPDVACKKSCATLDDCKFPQQCSHNALVFLCFKCTLELSVALRHLLEKLSQLQGLQAPLALFA